MFRTPFRIVAVVCLVCGAGFGAPATTTTRAVLSPEDLAVRLAEIEKALPAKLAESHTPGAAIAIVKDGKVAFVKGLGLRDTEKNLPATEDTLFAIGSCTKAFTALAAMMSVDEGKLTLDDSPRKYLPWFKLHDPDTDAKVTLRDLLCHRSGLAGTDLLWLPGVLTREEVLRAVGNARPTAKLGEKWQYQNVMYCAAGEVVAAAGKTTWEDDIRARILKPLGMKATDMTLAEMNAAADHATGYAYKTEPKKSIAIPMRNLASIAPAGAINSSARDMAQWLRLMLGRGEIDGRRLVSEKSFDQLVSRQMVIGGEVGYGLGWMILKWKGRTVWEHGGGIDGFTALVTILPDENLGVVVLANASGSAFPQSARDLIWSKLVIGPAPTTATAPTTAPSTASAPVATGPTVPLAAEAGTYIIGPSKIEVVLDDRRLFLIAPGQPRYPLQNVGGRRYKLGAPAPDGFFITFRPVPGKPDETEGYLEQPQGNFVVRRQAPATTQAAGGISAEELHKKIVAAAGGEETLRKQTSMVMTFDLDLPQQGVTGEGTIRSRAPCLRSSRITLKAAGKTLGTIDQYFDGKTGGQSGTFIPADPMTPRQIDSARMLWAFPGALRFADGFKTIVINKQSLAGEEVWAVTKTPEKGNAITETYSARTFLLMRRQFTEVGASFDIGEQVTETLDDYRSVDGGMVPFKVSDNRPLTLGELSTMVKEVKFNVDLPDDAFRAPQAK